MTQNNNVVGWFEIPVIDMDRAVKFYETVLGVTLGRHKMNEIDMAWFPMVSGASGAAGSLVAHPEWYKTSHDGVLVYFTAQSGDLSEELSRVESAGGQIVVKKQEIAPEYGHMAVFIDSEGNRVALHSMQ